MKASLTSVVTLLLALPAMAADEPKAAEPEPAVTIIVGPGQATATPLRQGSSHTGGGNIHVSQPTPDTLSVTMTGVAVARCHPCHPAVAQFSFDLTQGFEVVFNDPKLKGARLVMWGRTVGLLRSHCGCWDCKGAAEISNPGHAAVNCGPTELLALGMPPRAVSGGQNLSIHDREGPVWVPVLPGKYNLHQVFGISATHGKGLFCKAASAEFAPDPALDSEWIDKKEPFHGAAKKDFGFQVILKVVADEAGGAPIEQRPVP